MRREWITWVALSGLLSSVTLGVCEESSPKASAEFTDPAVAIVVKVDQEFVIALESNATTGYQWELAKPLSQAILKQVSFSYKAPETKRVGAGGKQLLTLRAVGVGKTKVSLKYVRPWEKNVAPVKEAIFSVEVH